MATGQSGVSDATVFVSLALFGVWMYRQKVKTLSGSPSRWGAFFGALSGKYTIVSNVSSAGTSSGSSTSTAPDPTSGFAGVGGSGSGGTNPAAGGPTSIVPN